MTAHTPHIKHISARLQAEVDAILATMDDKTLTVEIKDEQLIDMQTGDTHQVVRETLDERISFKLETDDRPHRLARTHNKGKRLNPARLFAKLFSY